MSNDTPQKKKITVKHEFIMLALVFLAPIIISAVLYNNLDKWQQGGRNNGDLIEPARLLEDTELTKLIAITIDSDKKVNLINDFKEEE